MSVNVQSTFNSICSYCGTTVQTSSDQTNNPRFICSKECRHEQMNDLKNDNFNNRYGPKIIPKYSNRYIPSYILSFLPKYWFQNDVRCNKCYNRFYSDDIPDYCDKCIYEKIPIDTTCISCSETINGTPYKLKLKKNMCIECFNLTDCDFLCTCCNTTYVDTHKAHNDLNKSICHTCRKSNRIKYKYLHLYVNNDTINNLLDINPNYNIKIFYKVTEDKHDIYCSDYEDNDCESESNSESNPEYNSYTSTLEFPLLNEFDSDSDLLLNNKDFHYFYTPHFQSCCSSGCIIMKYKIVNFEIQKL